MHALSPRRSAGFSLIELVIVVVIIGIIGAIAIPRLSRGAAGAADSKLAGDLAVLRNAIDLYAAEHNGTFPTLAHIRQQLTMYTDSQGGYAASKTANHIYGPYIRKIPAVSVGPRQGATGFGTADGANVGWFYNETTGVITCNASTETDTSGKLYIDY
ncbi:MAG: prepilin-type N-terminal cleavage/methylation domain-containing protein [Planctomycetota bacterium]